METNAKNRMNLMADQVDASLAVIRDEMLAAVAAAIEDDCRAADRLEAARRHAQAVLDNLVTMRRIINGA